jgi:hypothetical protein
MGFDLINEQEEYFRFNLVAWFNMLELARLGGWEPLGTEASGYRDDPEREWDGGYGSNDGAVVTAQDAAALADGLEAMLDDLPDCPIPDQVVDYAEVVVKEEAPALVKALASIGQELGGDITGPNPNLGPIQFFGGEKKGKIREFITYCRRGGFEIW